MFNRTSSEEREAKQAARVAEARRREAKEAEAAFWASSQGRARAAKRTGQRWYQVELDLGQTQRTWQYQARNVATVGHGAVLSEIEREGWELFQAGFFFLPTATVSRDKLVMSGQEIVTTGRSVGVYLFRATSAPAPEDEPWRAPAGQHAR